MPLEIRFLDCSKEGKNISKKWEMATYSNSRDIGERVSGSMVLEEGVIF